MATRQYFKIDFAELGTLMFKKWAEDQSVGGTYSAQDCNLAINLTRKTAEINFVAELKK